MAVLGEVLDVLGATWDKLNNTDEVFQAVNAILAKVEGAGSLDAAAIAKLATDALLDLVKNQIAAAAPRVILTKLNPQGAILSTVYSGVTWLVDNSQRLGGLLEKGVAVIAAVSDLTHAGGRRR